MITFGRTGVVGLGGTGSVTDSSSFSRSPRSSSATPGTFFFVVREREGLMEDFEEPPLAVVVRVDVLVDDLGGGLEGLVGSIFDDGLAWIASTSITLGRTPGGLPCRLGASIVSTSGSGSTSAVTTLVFFVARFGGAFSVLDDPAAALDRVVLASGFFGGSGWTLCPGLPFAAGRWVARAAVRGFGGGFAGVTGPSDRSLRREGSDGRGSAGAFRFGGIVARDITRVAS